MMSMYYIRAALHLFATGCSQEGALSYRLFIPFVLFFLVDYRDKYHTFSHSA